MDNKKILIIIAIAIVLAVVGVIVATTVQTNDMEYEILNLSDTCAVSVPVCNNSTFTNDDGVKSYNGSDLKIVSYNKNDLGEWENLGASIGVNGALNQNFKYNHSHHGKNILIHPDDNETIYACLISNNTTGDVVMVFSSSEEILYHVIDSVNFTVANNSNISNDATDDVSGETTDNGIETMDSVSESASEKTTDQPEYQEGYIAENDQDFDYDGDGVGDGSAYHSHEYYVEHGQTEPTTPAGR